MATRSYSVVLPSGGRFEGEQNKSTNNDEREESIRSRVSYLYEKMNLERAANEGALRMSEDASKVVHQSIEAEIFNRIAEDMASVSLLTERATQSLKEDDDGEIGPQNCIEFAFVFSQINQACERFARLVNPVSEALRKDLGVAAPRAATAKGGINRSKYYSRSGSPLKQTYQLLVATGKLLESIESLGRVFQGDQEIGRLMKLVAPEREEISDGFEQLSALIESNRGKWKGRVENARKIVALARN
jgi:hypothetical protein